MNGYLEGQQDIYLWTKGEIKKSIKMISSILHKLNIHKNNGTHIFQE